MNDFCIITGAAGFIGRNVVAQLNSEGYSNLLLVDRLGTDEKWHNLVGLSFDDVISPESLIENLENWKYPIPKCVIHLGACSATTERDASFLLENNFRYTKTLCEWSLANGARFIYASSAATYGDGSRGYLDDESLIEQLRPLNMYGYSKHMFDLWAKRHDLLNQIVGLKYFNVFGPYESHKGEMRSLVNKAYSRILQEGYIELFKSEKSKYKNGEQMRDFIYVKDAVNVTLYFMKNPHINGLFNCGTGEARTWIDLANALFSSMNIQPDIRFIDLPDALKNKYQYFTEANMSKLRTSGYHAPFTSLEDGISDYIQTYLDRDKA